MTPRLLLALQFSPIDTFDALKLAEVIAEIHALQSTQPRSDVQFALIYRRDVNKYSVRDIESILREAFTSVHLIKSKGFATGWPHGCNDLWQSGMMELWGMTRREKHPLEAPAVLTFEPDCIPLRPDWIEKLCEEWDRCHKAKKLVIGHVHTFENQTEPHHINGNAIFDLGIFGHPKGRELQGSSASQGWDAYHGKLLLELGMDTPFIAQKYRLKEIYREDLEAIRKHGHVPALFHGVKESCAIGPVRGMMRDGTFVDPERMEFNPLWNYEVDPAIAGVINKGIEALKEADLYPDYSATADAL